MPKPFYAANWKMYWSHDQQVAYITQNLDQYQQLATTHDIAIFPGFTELAPIAQLLKHSNISVGAQDCSAHDAGAYTGQISAQSLRELGCSYVIIGHSERRALGETDQVVAQKVEQAFRASISPIICIGEPETLHSQTKLTSKQEFLTDQLIALLSILSTYKQMPFTIAYEPIWAIGSGITPNPDEIEEVQHFIRSFITQETDARDFRILYGGSVTPQNCVAIQKLPSSEGFLIGKASLDIAEFAQIINMLN